jgi:hypothetical protein
MLSQFEIILILLLLIIIIFIIYALIKPKKKPLTKIQKLLENVYKVFNMSIQDNFTQDTDIIFKKPNDIVANMITFCDYTFPKMNINDINSILKENGLNKTAQEIFNEHKDDTFDTFKLSFNFIDLMLYYAYIMLNDIDKTVVKDNIRLYIITYFSFFNIQNNKILELPTDILDSDKTNYTIKTINIIINKDYKTSDEIVFYSVTNMNENIPFSSAKEVPSKDQNILINDCLTKDLCKNTKLINYDITTASDEIKKQIIKLFNLRFAMNLFNLNNTSIPQNIQKTFDETYAILQKM